MGLWKARFPKTHRISVRPEAGINWLTNHYFPPACRFVAHLCATLDTPLNLVEQ